MRDLDRRSALIGTAGLIGLTASRAFAQSQGVSQAAAGTPLAVIDRLHAEIVRALAEPDVRERIAGLGAEPVGNTPAEFAAMQRSEALRWTRLAKEANIHAD